MSALTRDKVRAALARGQRTGGSALDEIMTLLAESQLAEATLVHEGLSHGGFRGHIIPDDNSIWDLPAGTRVVVIEAASDV